MTTNKTTCYANVTRDRFYSSPCGKTATAEVGGYDLCGTHARVARKWLADYGADRLDSLIGNVWGPARVFEPQQYRIADNGGVFKTDPAPDLRKKRPACRNRQPGVSRYCELTKGHDGNHVCGEYQWGARPKVSV